jgi:hypothetical protein
MATVRVCDRCRHEIVEGNVYEKATFRAMNKDNESHGLLESELCVECGEQVRAFASAWTETLQEAFKKTA